MCHLLKIIWGIIILHIICTLPLNGSYKLEHFSLYSIYIIIITNIVDLLVQSGILKKVKGTNSVTANIMQELGNNTFKQADTYKI